MAAIYPRFIHESWTIRKKQAIDVSKLKRLLCYESQHQSQSNEKSIVQFNYEDYASNYLGTQSTFNLSEHTLVFVVVLFVCVCPVWVPCVALPSGGGSSVGPSPLCWSPVWVPCAGPLCGSPVGPLCVSPLCGSPLCESPVRVPCEGPLSVGPSSRCVPCGIYSRDVSRLFTRSRSIHTHCVRWALYHYYYYGYLSTRDSSQEVPATCGSDQRHMFYNR